MHYLKNERILPAFIFMRHRDNQNPKSNRGDSYALMKRGGDDDIAQCRGSGFDIMIEKAGLCFPSKLSHLDFLWTVFFFDSFAIPTLRMDSLVLVSRHMANETFHHFHVLKKLDLIVADPHW